MKKTLLMVALAMLTMMSGYALEDEEQKMFLYMEGVMKVIEPNSR